MIHPNYPDGIPPHGFEPRKGPAMDSLACDYCGKHEEHAAHGRTRNRTVEENRKITSDKEPVNE